MSQKIHLRTESFDVSQKEEGVQATGLALPFGVESRNGATYDKESVKENADSLKGKSVLYNHNPDRPPLGRVEDVQYTEDGLEYKIDFDEEEKEIIRKIKQGYLNNVSIQALVDEEKSDETLWIEEFMELTVTPLPGFPETTLDSESMSVTTFVEEYMDGDGETPDEADDDISEEEGESTSKEPFGPWEDFDDCVDDMMANQGYDEETAKKVCGALQDELEEFECDYNDGDKMTDAKDDETESEAEAVEVGQVDLQNLFALVADMAPEGVEVADVTSALEDLFEQEQDDDEEEPEDDDEEEESVEDGDEEEDEEEPEETDAEEESMDEDEEEESVDEEEDEENPEDESDSTEEEDDESEEESVDDGESKQVVEPEDSESESTLRDTLTEVL